MSRSQTAVGVSDWIDTVRRAAEERYFSDQFHIEGLEVVLKSIDPSLVRWVLKYLQPLSLGSEFSKKERYTFFCLYSDDFVIEANRYLNLSSTLTFYRYGKDDVVLKCARISRSITLFCNPREGIFWLTDFDGKTLFIVFSSRTSQPAIEFARTVRNIVACYLEDQGWVSYHAGAVDTASGALMIVGNSGAGKTSLILALVRGGARYIANERLFVREDTEGIRVLGYPMAIAVGLGTALQFPGLADLVDSPDALLYPRHRYSASRVAQTPRAERAYLDDKIQLIPEELVTYVGASGAVPGGNLCALVAPCISKTPVTPVADTLDYREAFKVLSDNYMGQTNESPDSAWSEMILRENRLSTKNHSIEGLSKIDALRFHYCLPATMDKCTYNDMILDAISTSI